MRTVAEIEDYARGLMAEHGLEGWTFQWCRAINYMGITYTTRKVIALSKPNMLHCSETEVEDTILHEIAHALAPAGEGHGPQWKSIAASLGARPEEAYIETGPSLRDKAAPWVGRCAAGHESEHRYFRKPKLRRSCSVCNPGRFSPDHILTYTKEV